MNTKKTTTPHNLLIGAAALTTLACAAATPQVDHAIDPELDTMAYRTYTIPNSTVGNATAEADIKEAIHMAMARNGFVAVEADPDLVVNFKVLTAGGMTAPLPPGAGMGVGGGINDGILGPDVGLTPQDVDPASAPMDKLVMIQLQDAKTMKVVWVGWSQAEVTLTNLRNRAAEAAFTILRRLPART